MTTVWTDLKTDHKENSFRDEGISKLSPAPLDGYVHYSVRLKHRTLGLGRSAEIEVDLMK